MQHRTAPLRPGTPNIRMDKFNGGGRHLDDGAQNPNDALQNVTDGAQDVSDWPRNPTEA